MMIEKIPVRITSQRIIPHISEEFARAYQVEEGHQSVAFFSTDNDDVAYLAVDDATKKARISLVHARTFYGGLTNSWSRNGGSILVLFSGPRVEDVRSGLHYVNDYVKNHGALYCFDQDEGTAFYAKTVSRTGKYFQKEFGVPEGAAYTYLFGGPIESAYALDKALKASDTRMTHYWAPPSVCNSCGAILSGTESACKQAEAAYVEALRFAIGHPQNL